MTWLIWVFWEIQVGLYPQSAGWASDDREGGAERTGPNQARPHAVCGAPAAVKLGGCASPARALSFVSRSGSGNENPRINDESVVSGHVGTEGPAIMMMRL